MTSFRLLATLNLCLGGLVFLLGMLILIENPRQRLNRVVSLMLFFGGLGSILAALSFLAAGPAGVAGPAAGGAANGQGSVQGISYLWEFFFPTLFLFASIFPEERAFTRRGAGIPWLRWGPSFTTLVFAPHVFHFILAFVFATLVYYYRVFDPADARAQFPGVYRFLQHKWYFDELYDLTLVRPTLALARGLGLFDKQAVDGVVNGAAWGTELVSRIGGVFDPKGFDLNRINRDWKGAKRRRGCR